MPDKGEWTLETLFEHVRMLLHEHDRLDAARFANLEASFKSTVDARDRELKILAGGTREALAKAEVALEKRLDALNEIRGALADQNLHFLTKDEYRASHQGLERLVEDVKEVQIEARSKTTGMNQSWAFLAGGLGLFFGFASLVLSLYFRSH